MIELETDPAQVSSVAGIRLGCAQAGIKYKNRYDLVVMELPDGAQVAGVFTQNAFSAAPVQVAKNHLAQHKIRYLVINSGNANAGTGARGKQDALLCCQYLADKTKCLPDQVLPFSTGVIGEFLPMERMKSGISDALADLRSNAWYDAAQAIMTTDTQCKLVSTHVTVDGHDVSVVGMAKGAGMIRPDMATLLTYIATDAKVDAKILQHCLNNAVGHSFNRITVDGDTSTNDACILVASGRAAMAVIDDIDSDAYYALSQAIGAVCEHLAKAIIRDAEGATKFITIEVVEGNNEQECENVAYTIAHSPLVKTAFFASDPNWGRLIMAIGRAGVPGLDPEQVQIHLNGTQIVHNGMRADDYTEAKGQAAMQPQDITIRIALGRGNTQVKVWTCDFSYDYVKINAEYRS